MTELRNPKDDFTYEYFALFASSLEPSTAENITIKAKLPVSRRRCDQISLHSILLDNIAGLGLIFIECSEGLRNTTFTNYASCHYPIGSITPIEVGCRRLRAVPVLAKENSFQSFYEQFNDAPIIAEGDDLCVDSDQISINIYNQHKVSNDNAENKVVEFSDVYLILKLRMRKRNTIGSHVIN
jgi:hypothetical protein